MTQAEAGLMIPSGISTEKRSEIQNQPTAQTAKNQGQHSFDSMIKNNPLTAPMAKNKTDGVRSMSLNDRNHSTQFEREDSEAIIERKIRDISLDMERRMINNMESMFTRILNGGNFVRSPISIESETNTAQHGLADRGCPVQSTWMHQPIMQTGPTPNIQTQVLVSSANEQSSNRSQLPRSTGVYFNPSTNEQRVFDACPRARDLLFQVPPLEVSRFDRSIEAFKMQTRSRSAAMIVFSPT